MNSWIEVRNYIQSLLKPGLTNATNVQNLLNSFLSIINLLNGGSMDPQNDAEWKPDVNYPKDVQPVLWRDTWLVSNISNNTGIQPISDQGVIHPAWRTVSSSIGSGIRIWTPIVYPNILEIVFYQGVIYYLDRDVVGMSPFLSADFTTEFAAEKWAILTGGETLKVDKDHFYLDDTDGRLMIAGPQSASEVFDSLIQ
jgi:hypothetical protein